MAKDAEATIPDPDGTPNKRKPTMLTTDLALRLDPEYEKISRRFHADLDEFRLAFAKAWYKLLHRDMGPIDRYLGPLVAEPQLWQDPLPAHEGPLVSDSDVAGLKAKAPRVRSGRRPARPYGVGIRSQLPRHRQARWCQRRPHPAGAAEGLAGQRADRARRRVGEARAGATEFNSAGGAQISLADLIVLAGSAAVEKAAKDAGHEVTVPFTPGRTDASQEQTDVESFAVLEPRADGFRNYLRAGEKLQPETLLVDKANLLRLSAPEMTVLVGGLRALGANVGGSQNGVLTDRAGSLTNDFFVNLLAPGTEWKASESAENVYEIRDLATGQVRWTATDVDLVFGSNSQLRAIAEVYASEDAKEKFVADFVAAWVKVMDADRFDVQS